MVIGGAALLLFGPKRLPELGKSLGKGIRDFKKALDGESEPTTPARPEQISAPHEAVETPETQAKATDGEKKSNPQS